MTDTAIRVENLSKRHHVGRARQRHDTLMDALVARLRVLLERPNVPTFERSHGVRNRTSGRDAE